MLILRERLGNTEAITLNRPEAGNSLNPPLMDELGRALQEILDDVDARAVVRDRRRRPRLLRRHGPQLPGRLERPGSPVADRPGARALAASWPAPIPSPWSPRSTAPPSGGGLELVMACDLVVAADSCPLRAPRSQAGPVRGRRRDAARHPDPPGPGPRDGADRSVDRRRPRRAVRPGQPGGPRGRPAGRRPSPWPTRWRPTGPWPSSSPSGSCAPPSAPALRAGMATPDESRSIFTSEDAREGAAAFMEKRAAVFVGR